MHEDDVLWRAIAWFTERGWKFIYQTLTVAEGAFGGVVAILMKVSPWRSGGFTNCLGALIKRIRFERGYLSNEAIDRFIRLTWPPQVPVCRQLSGVALDNKHRQGDRNPAGPVRWRNSYERGQQPKDSLCNLCSRVWQLRGVLG